MALLLASARVARRPQVRALGNRARGPARHVDVKRHLQYARAFFREPAVTYDGVKQQCESLRLIVYFAVTVGLAADLALRPLQSSYWRRFAPTSALRNLLDARRPGRVLRDEPGATEGYDAFKKLTAKA